MQSSGHTVQTIITSSRMGATLSYSKRSTEASLATVEGRCNQRKSTFNANGIN